MARWDTVSCSLGWHFEANPSYRIVLSIVKMNQLLKGEEFVWCLFETGFCCVVLADLEFPVQLRMASIL